ncbi:MAG: LysR family transcriptional regulator, nitrogen assimilation regulatory protein [Rhodospirillaceae bacterium]|nr:LysR family transcriptional regulator, nitrogen assimilation regulatory protein [Rhodospirillaceae bacterium]
MEKTGIDLRRLRYFIAVCEHGGFSRASNSIGIAQPSLTRQVKLLEKEIGLPLINRTGRGAEPTEEGRFLLNGSRQHIEGLNDLVRELRRRTSTFSGEVVIGVCPTIAPFFLDDLKSHIRETHPSITLSVIEAHSGDLQNLMASNKLDLSITHRPTAPMGADFVELFSESLVLVSAYSPEQDQCSRTLAEISRMKLILPSVNHELRRIIDRVCAASSVSLRPDLELDSLDAIKAVIVGKPMQYGTILPFHSVKQEVNNRQLCCYRIDDKGMHRTIAVVIPSDRANSEITALLLDAIRQHSTLLKAKLDTIF